MEEGKIILECPSCSTKKEIDIKLLKTKKRFRCDNIKCKFGNEHYGWIKQYPSGKVIYPYNHDTKD